MQLFGFEFKRQEKEQPELPSFAPSKETDDGALVVSAGGAYGTMVDLDGTVRSEAELVTKYREMALHPECDSAIDEIVNESIAIDDKNLVKIDLDSLRITEPLKKVIREEFENCLKIIEFNRYAYEIYRRWYIDGRLYYHVVIDESNPKEGIKELRYIDPRKIRKVREVQKKRAAQNISEPVLTKVVNEYYIFNDKGFNYGNKAVGASNTTGLKIAKDSIIHVVSGLTDNQGTMVLSYLHKAIKALNQLSTLEDALVIYRLARAPERRIWYIDVGNLPKMKAEQYVRDIMVKHKNRLIYDAATGCFAMDTKIPLLDGRTLSISEIENEMLQGKVLWAYSCDPKTGNFAPGIITWAGVTRKSAEVLKITFDNGKSVVCTLDHNFPVWGKGFVQAQNLQIGESMIPHYTKMAPVVKEEPNIVYEQIFDNVDKKWKFTHRQVSKWKDSLELVNECVYNKTYVNEEKNTVHHIDYNKFNNSPDNIVRMNNKDHWLMHSETASRLWDSEEYRKKQKDSWDDERRESVSFRGKQIPIERFIKMNILANESRWSVYENRVTHSVKQTTLYTQEIIDYVFQCAKNKEKYQDVIDHINSNSKFVDNWAKLNVGKRIRNKNFDKTPFNYNDIIRIGYMFGYKTWKEFTKGKNSKYISKTKTDKYVLVLKNKRIGTFNSLEEAIEARQHNNHKIVSIEKLKNPIEVGTITIDGNEIYHDYHTFALDAGVYTKNSVRDDRKFMTMLEDYWLPRREGGRGTEVSTLPGGQNLGQMDDVLYFQKKFLQTLNVPISRLNSDALFSIGRATEITRDELKFERFITRLRSRFSHLFIKMLEKQLVLKGITTIEDWQLIQNQIRFDFAKDNYFAELKKAEILQNRISQTRDMQDMAGKYVSHSWIRKNVMQQSDEDIEQQDILIGLENQSGDPRWVNPMIMQNEQIAASQQQEMGADQEQPEQSDGDRDKLEQVRQAIGVVNLTKKKPVDQRTPQEQSNYKAAVQLVAKNPDIVQQLGTKIY